MSRCATLKAIVALSHGIHLRSLRRDKNSFQAPGPLNCWDGRLLNGTM